jgi:ABC-type Zn uptake system ZnuABC Zn-binding protein ZnuA
MNFTPKAGDIAISEGGTYRLYYSDTESKYLRCMNLYLSEAYTDVLSNTKGTNETYICNMKDIVDNATR